MVREAKRLTSKSNIAREYIVENIYKQSKCELINQVMSDTGLKYKTIETIYLEIQTSNMIQLKEKNKAIRKAKEIETYKGRHRKFFKFDDRNLYKGLIK
ncbi:MAG: hypothetical protein SPH93_16245 [Clostridium sp.]|jgi:hypothetical protein|uniref:hypothetical protein n=1 Tax=Clostridium sp. TaxID=1506 RepID=UPI0025C1F213|nr:hypothetical protein [Clostridium sp.]MDY2630069.1 hypothetical protein [Clostridium sp.]MDY6229182.1 hypothetical protein [Clostridium sp.]